MKKILLILLICSYSFATMGFSLREFYCCGKLKSVTLELTPNNKETCSKCNEKKDCCNSKYHFFKVKENHISGKDADVTHKYFLVSGLPPSVVYEISFSSPLIDVINGSHAPPLYTGVPIYISNCIFII